MAFWLQDPRFYGWTQRFVTRRDCWSRFVESYLRPVARERLLDLGCGIGRLLDFLPPLEYYGLDSNPSYIRYAQTKAKERAVFVCADLCQAPWPVEGLFDRVAATGVFHHLPDEQVLTVLKNARKVMKPGATLVTFDGCYEKPQSYAARLLLSMDRGKYVRDQKGYEALAHSVFDRVRVHMERKFLRVPYSHMIMQMTAD